MAEDGKCKERRGKQAIKIEINRSDLWVSKSEEKKRLNDLKKQKSNNK